MSIAWNVFGNSFTGHGRDLGPTSRGIVAAVADAPLAGYALPEAMRGALPFYTGRIALHLRSEEDLGRYLREHPGATLLASDPPPEELRANFGEWLSPLETWGEFRAAYTMYEILAEPRDRSDEPGR
ncbi:MAG TPA: hypothetical protein VIY27_01870 [Myxococcota bacterium]